MRRIRLLTAVVAILALTASLAVAAEPAKAISKQAAPDKGSKPPVVDPVTETVEEDALTQIRIAAISFQDPQDLGQALSGVIGAFLMRDRLKDALVDLSVIHDPVWRADALLHFAGYHYQKGELSAAKRLLLEADALTRQMPAESDESTVLTLVSQRLAEYGDYAAARQTASRIAEPQRRIAHLIELGDLQGTEFEKARGGGRRRDAFASPSSTRRRQRSAKRSAWRCC